MSEMIQSFDKRVPWIVAYAQLIYMVQFFESINIIIKCLLNFWNASYGTNSVGKYFKLRIYVHSDYASI